MEKHCVFSKKNHALIFRTIIHSIIRGGEEKYEDREREAEREKGKRKRIGEAREELKREQMTQGWVVPRRPPPTMSLPWRGRRHSTEMF